MLCTNDCAYMYIVNADVAVLKDFHLSNVKSQDARVDVNIAY